jgi:hypothetical protein
VTCPSARSGYVERSTRCSEGAAGA